MRANRRKIEIMGAFKEIGKTKINNTKNLVVSRMGDDKYAIAQQLLVKDDADKELKIFLKNSIIVDIDGLEDIGNLLVELARSEKGETPAETPVPKKKLAKKL